MRRAWCMRVLDALCPCFRRRSSRSSSISGASGRHNVSMNFILHGECGVGKTSLRNRWVDGAFTGDVAPTFGVDFNIKTLDLVQEEEEEGEEVRGEGPAGETLPRAGGKDGTTTKQGPCADLQVVKINVYDTSGKPSYREVNSTYLLAFDAVIFVYDISSMSTLNELRRYFHDPEHRDKLAAKRKAGMSMLLVGNKCDLPLSERQVGSQTGQDTATEFGIPFVEVSAKTGANVREAFMFVTTRAVAEHLARDRLKQFVGSQGSTQVKTTMQKVPGLYRAMRTRASALDVYKGATGYRDHVQKAFHTEEITAVTSEGTAVALGDDKRRRHLPLPRRRVHDGRGGSGHSGSGAAEPASTRLVASPQRHSSRVDSSSARMWTVTTFQGLRGAKSPVVRSGTGDAATATLLEMPELSLAELESFSNGFEFPTARASTLGAAERAKLTIGHRSRGMSPERTTGGGGGGSRGGGVVSTETAENSVARELRAASSFWLDKWGIKAAKTDATRDRGAGPPTSRASHP